jgi:hypothetical protein
LEGEGGVRGVGVVGGCGHCRGFGGLLFLLLLGGGIVE